MIMVCGSHTDTVVTTKQQVKSHGGPRRAPPCPDQAQCKPPGASAIDSVMMSSTSSLTATAKAERLVNLPKAITSA